MPTGLFNLIRVYVNWVALVLLAAGLFTAVIARSPAVPLGLIGAAICIAAIRNWEAIRDFDVWALDEWMRARVDAIGVRDWQAPYHAAEIYCNQNVVRARNDAATTMNVIMMELVKDEGRPVFSRADATHLRGSDSSRRHADYDEAQTRFNQCNATLARELRGFLVHGHLMAKGLLMQKDVAKSERIIPTARWRIMNLDIAKAEAWGAGWSYSGVVIGRKPMPERKPQQKSAGN